MNQQGAYDKEGVDDIMELVPQLGLPILLPAVGGEASLPAWREALVAGDDD